MKTITLYRTLRFRFWIFTALAILTIGLKLEIQSCYAQASGYISVKEVPAAVQQKFKLLYPEEEITKATWEFEHNGYEAYLKDKEGRTTDVLFFSVEGKLEYRILTDNRGLRTGTEREKEPYLLPQAIHAHLAEACKGKKILAAVELLDLQDNITGYLVILDDRKIAYDGKGQYLKIDSAR